MARIERFLLALALAPAIHAADAARPPECAYSCMPGEPCQVSTVTGAQAVVLEHNTVRKLTDCTAITVTGNGKLEVLIQVRGNVERLVVSKDRPIGPLIARLEPSCLASSPHCSEELDSRRQALPAGKPFDGKALPERAGKPCELGLPCGTIALPKGALDLRLEDAQAAGELRVMAVRGANTQLAVPVAGGRASLPAGSLSPGAAYRYALVGAANEAIAAGQFVVVSTRMQADIDSELESAKATTTRSAELATLEALLANNLDWDARQFLINQEKRP